MQDWLQPRALKLSLQSRVSRHSAIRAAPIQRSRETIATATTKSTKLNSPTGGAALTSPVA